MKLSIPPPNTLRWKEQRSTATAAASLFLCLTAIVIAVAAVLVVVYSAKQAEPRDISWERRENLHSMVSEQSTMSVLLNKAANSPSRAVQPSYILTDFLTASCS